MQLQKEIDLLRSANLIQAIAIEILNEWLCGEGGEDWRDSWCEAIELAVARENSMLIAQKNEYSQTRKNQFNQWLSDRRGAKTPEKKEAV